MAIRLETEYVNAVAANANYPGGSFKNRTTQGVYDGTPLDKKWANDWLGFFYKLLVSANITPSGAPDNAVTSDYYNALIAIIGSILGAHASQTDVHGATRDPTPYMIMRRGQYGRCKVAAPLESDDIAIKSTVDTVSSSLSNHAGLSSAHNSAVTPTANRIAMFGTGGRIKSNPPVDENDCVRKVDLTEVSDAFNTHEGSVVAHASTSTPISERIAAYDRNGKLSSFTPIEDTHVARKFETDRRVKMYAGSYIGDGTDDRNISIGANLSQAVYKFVVLKSIEAHPAVHKNSNQIEEDTQYFTATAISNSNQIQTWTSTGFVIGSHDNVNKLNVKYSFTVFYQMSA